MNSLESTESVELDKYFCKKCVFEPATSCVTNQHATTVPVRHVRGGIFKLSPNSCISDLPDSLNSLNSVNSCSIQEKLQCFRRSLSVRRVGSLWCQGLFMVPAPIFFLGDGISRGQGIPTHPPPNHKSRWYASYQNAFLLINNFGLKNFVTCEHSLITSELIEPHL